MESLSVADARVLALQAQGLIRVEYGGLRVLDIDALRTLVWAPSAELLSKQ